MVSCVTITTGSDSIEIAIKCFLNQTYKFIELIIVSQATREQNLTISELIKPYSNIYFVPVPLHLNYGEMLNLSIELAHGDVICQWSARDFYASTRVMSQFKALRENAIACVYNKYLILVPETKEAYLLRNHELNCSIMFRKQIFHETENCLYSESLDGDKEEILYNRLKSSGNIAFPSSGHEYCLVGKNFNIENCMSEKELLYNKNNIEKTLGPNVDVLDNKKTKVFTCL